MKDAVFLLIFAGIPTIFLYFIAFGLVVGAASFFVGMRKGLWAGAILALATAIVVPAAANRAVYSRLEAEPPRDKRPSQALRIGGDVLIGTSEELRDAKPTDSPWACKEICSLLLATPGVRTVTAVDGRRAATFAVSEDAACTIDPRADFASEGVLFWRKLTRCAKVLPPVRTFDYSIELDEHHVSQAFVFPAAELEGLPVRSMVTKVRDSSGRILMQITQRHVTRIVTPLSFCWTLDLYDNKGFCAVETGYSPEKQLIPHRQVLADFANLPDMRDFIQPPLE